MKKLIFLLWIIPLIGFGQGKTISFQKNMQIFDGQASSYYLNTSSTAQAKIGRLTVATTIGSGSAAAPALAFGDGNTGFYEISDNALAMSISGTNSYRLNYELFDGYNNYSFRLHRTNSSTTIPTIVPYGSDLNTGIGHPASDSDSLSLIAGGVEGIRIAEGGGIIKVTVTDTLQVDGLLAATGIISGKTGITLDTDATIVLATADCRNKSRFNNDADVIDYTLPGAAAGLVVMFYDIGGGVITVDPVDGTDTIYLNGTSVGAGDAIDSPGSVGDFICLMAIDATRWVTVGRSGTWIDGGAD